MFIGIACLFAGLFDLMHALSYKGMSVFSEISGDESIQLKTAGRWLASLSFLIAPLFFRRRINLTATLVAYSACCAVVVYSIFWDLLPDFYVAGVGMNRSQQMSRGISCVIFLAAAALLIIRRRELDARVFRLLLASLIASSFSELASAVSVDFYGFLKVIAHLSEVISLYFIYKAFIELGLTRPYNLLFRSLTQSEEQIRLLLNTTAEAIFGCDLNGICTFCNHACVRLLGYKHQDELIGKNMHYLMHHSHADGTPVPFAECPTFQMDKRGEHLHYEDAVLWRANGTCFHAEYWNHLQRVSGKVVGITGSFYDITERKQMEEALRSNEQWHRRVAENMSDMIWAMDFTGRIIYMSPSIRQMLGFTPEEVTQLTYEQMATPSSLGPARKKFEEALAMAMANQRVEIDCFEMEFFHKDGSTAWGELSVSGMYDKSGNVIGFQGMTRDITKRKRMEEALRDSERRYRTLLENAPDGFIFHDVNGKIHDVNRRICELLGYSREELINESVFVFEVGIKPESLLEHTWVLPEVEFPTTVYGIHRRKDGSTYPAEIHLNLIRIDGQRMIMAMVRDITQRKMAEDALRESEERYRILFESSRDALVTSDLITGKFTSGNPAAIELFRASSLDEFTSKRPWDLSPEYQPDGRKSADKFREMIENAITRGNNSFEWIHKRLDGEEFPSVVLLTRCELNGQVFLQGSVRDITDQKRVEDELRNQTQLLSTVIDGIPDVIALQKPDQTIIRYNKAGYAFHGLPPEEVHGRKCYEVLGRDAPCEICATENRPGHEADLAR